MSASPYLWTIYENMPIGKYLSTSGISIWTTVTGPQRLKPHLATAAG
jgi:hypothetical protein